MQAVSIYEPIREGLTRVEENLRNLARRRFPFLAELLGHIFEPPGKRVRPAITLLAANFHPHDRAKIEIMATAVEMLHVATLIHDDTVDNSEVRRGKPTISSIWGRNVAVLAGDYIFAGSATFVCDTENIAVIRRFSETIMELSSGELQEIAEAYDHGHTRESYLQRIFNKTASLFTTAAQSGAVLSGASEDVVRALKDYGLNLGMAFQIADDILDLEGNTQEIGKPVGSDLSHGIMTLPAIVAVEGYPKDNPIADLFQDPHDGRHLERAVDMIQSSGAIEDSFAVAKEYRGRALESLRILPQNPSRDSLEELAAYVVTRRT